ncbi:hypothetical protein PUM93_004276 [Escherichia coli]|nr:hypothetical protein [Escherichia coli]
MKQMSLIEMDGFLKGKCIPCDLKVNETKAEYLVRKFAEAEAKISALYEDHQKAIESIKQADAAVKLAHEKFSALAAENEAIKFYLRNGPVIRKGDELAAAHQFAPETPATDAFLAEVRAQRVEMMREHLSIKLCSLTHICDELVDQLRKGGNQ